MMKEILFNQVTNVIIYDDYTYFENIKKELRTNYFNFIDQRFSISSNRDLYFETFQY